MKRMFMKRTHSYLLTLFFLFNLSWAVGQDVNKYEQYGLFQHYIEYETAPPLQSVEAFVKEHFKANANYGLKILNVETDDLGITHYRLQQTYNNVEIAKTMLLIHVKDGKVISTNGEWYKQLPSTVNAVSSLSMEAALQKALDKVNARTYIWETQEAKNIMEGKAVQKTDINYAQPEGELIYVAAGNSLDADDLTLTYKFDIYAVEPFSREEVYVDVHSGEVVFTESLIHEVNVAGTAITGYYGSKPVTVDQVGNIYYARQTGTRNFELYNRNTTVTSSSSTFSGTGNARYYMDVYWGAEVTWDFLKEKFNRNGYNNAGSKITLVVNDPQANNNAYWMGSTASFGNSNGTPFTSLDVVSHEITHGVTATSAGLIYQGESGAMNEGFSDIFGAYAEHYAGVGQKWIIGENISFQRSLSNPNQYRQPDTYRGTYWAPTSGADNGGVHTNSGVLNYWFYLTSEGGSGTNDIGSRFTVNGIGIEKAAQIAYRALTRYLTASSGYSAARTAVVNAARDLYGTGSCEEAAATNAMHAVGVGTAFTGNCGGGGGNCDALAGLGVSQISTTGATVSWTAVPGINNYTLEYKTSTSSTYTAVVTNTNSRALTGLTPSTTYNVRVKYTCSNGTEAAYASTTFTTQADNQACSAISGLSVESITTTSAAVSWNAVSGISTYTVEYKTTSSSTYTSLTANGRTTNLSGLTPGTGYDVRVRYTCSNGQPSAYASATFTTKTDGGGDNGCDGIAAWDGSTFYYPGDKAVYNGTVYEATANVWYYAPTDTRYWRNAGPCDGGNDDTPCVAVSGLKATNITSTSAQISWNAVNGVSTYNFEFKTSTSTTYTTETVTANSEPFTGLTAGVTYNVRISYTCANGTKAPYSSVTFTAEGGGDDNPGGGCNGLAEYQTGKIYAQGDRVVYQGIIYEAQIGGIYWAPNYGWWTNLGPCSSTVAESGLTLYPNPAKQVVKISLVNHQEKRKANVYIFNKIGMAVRVQPVELRKGANAIDVNIQQLQPGVYTLKVDGETQRLVVQ